MNPDLAVKVTQNLQARYARLKRGCWRLLRANAELREQVRSADANAYYIAELEEANAGLRQRIAELDIELWATKLMVKELHGALDVAEDKLAEASQPERRWRDAEKELPEPYQNVEVRTLGHLEYYDDGELGWYADGDYVDHWRPLEGGDDGS